MKKPELDKWNFLFEVVDVYEMMVPLLADMNIGVYKFTSFPREGERIQKKHYKWFLITIRFYKWFEFR